MLVRFQRVRVALVAAQMFCVAYFNTEEFPFKMRFPPFEESDIQTDEMIVCMKSQWQILTTSPLDCCRHFDCFYTQMFTVQYIQR